MTTVLMALDREIPYETPEGALGPVLALAEALIAVTHLGGLWSRHHGAHLPINEATLALQLAEAPCLCGDLPARATNTIPLCARPGGPGEVGFLSLYLRTHAPERPYRGLRVIASLSDDAFNLAPDILLGLLERSVVAFSPDFAAIGPRGFVREFRVGWATYARGLARGVLGAGLAVLRAGPGSIVIAHKGNPDSESQEARDAVGGLSRTLGLNRHRVQASADGSQANPLHSSVGATHASEPNTPHLGSEIDTVPSGASPWAGHASPARPALGSVEPPSMVPPGMQHFKSLTGTEIGIDTPAGPALPFSPRAMLPFEVRSPELRSSGDDGDRTAMTPTEEAGPVAPRGSQGS